MIQFIDRYASVNIIFVLLLEFCLEVLKYVFDNYVNGLRCDVVAFVYWISHIVTRQLFLTFDFDLLGLPDGTVCVIRTKEEIAKNPDRITLDRRGLTTLPKLDDIPNLRLLSLQHNLLNSLEGFKQHNFTFIVFLDLYDNQLEKINCLDMLLNLRILLMGKNRQLLYIQQNLLFLINTLDFRCFRIKVVEGLDTLTRIEVLDLHGNQIVHVTGLSSLSKLKVLNLAGNQISNIGHSDLRGLCSLQELNLRRNRLRKLLGFGDTPNLQKLFLSNNELQS